MVEKVTQHWEESISFLTKSAVELIECGQDLLDAKEHMDPDEFTQMLRNSLPDRVESRADLIPLSLVSR